LIPLALLLSAISDSFRPGPSRATRGAIYWPSRFYVAGGFSSSAVAMPSRKWVISRGCCRTVIGAMPSCNQGTEKRTLRPRVGGLGARKFV
jgi:hypothetical protein